MRLKGLLAVLIVAGAILLILMVIQTKPGERIQTQVESFSAAKEKTTRLNMQTLQREIVSFMSSTGKVPENLTEMISNRTLVADARDSWGNPVEYERISDLSFKLTSSGRDGKFNTPDDIILEYGY